MPAALPEEVVPDAACNEPVFIFAREFAAIRCIDGVGRAVGIAFHGDCRNGDNGTGGESLFEVVVLRLALRQRIHKR